MLYDQRMCTGSLIQLCVCFTHFLVAGRLIPAQRRANRRCAALSRSVQRPKGARLSAGLCGTVGLHAWLLAKLPLRKLVADIDYLQSHDIGFDVFRSLVRYLTTIRIDRNSPDRVLFNVNGLTSQ